MRFKILSTVALLISLLALGIVVTSRSSETRPSTDLDVRKLESSLERLEARMEVLERSGGEVLDQAVDAPAKLGGDRVEDPLAEVLGRQRKLEARLEELGVLEHFETQRKKVDESYVLLLDEEAELWSRLDALAEVDGAERVDDHVVAAMLPLWAESFNAEQKGGHIRWYLLEHLRGTTNPEFRTQLLEWIGGEESPKMRAQGVRALVPMLPDPNVEEWLRHIAADDPDAGIRGLANQGLDQEAK